LAGHSLAFENLIMRDDDASGTDRPGPPRWAEALMRAVLRADDAETACGDLLEAYRDSIYPNRGYRRASLWYVRQVAGYVARSHPRDWSPRLTSTLFLLGLGLPVGAVVVAFGGGMILLLSLSGSVVALVSASILWLGGKHRTARKTLAALSAYLFFYVAVSTAVSLLQRTPHEHPLGIGQEVCADAGCFAVDRVEKSTVDSSERVYTLWWHLSSREKEAERRFPGKGLELYMFDERGRKFAISAADHQDPLDVALRAGETVRQVMRFHVPADASELFLTARYRPFTFQSLLPGDLSLLPRPPAKMIRIQ
jgi:hypothetical protein